MGGPLSLISALLSARGAWLDQAAALRFLPLSASELLFSVFRNGVTGLIDTRVCTENFRSLRVGLQALGSGLSWIVLDRSGSFCIV